MFKLFNSKFSYKTLNLIEVSKSALQNNFEYLTQINPNAKICPVLKSNAYGHGLKLIGGFVDREIRPEFICVDSLYEAYELQKINVESKILILGYTFPENFKYKKINFHLPVFDIETLEILNKTQSGINVHIKIDTGMSRLGIKQNEVEKFSRLLKKFNRVKVAGIYTHLSSADDVGVDETKFTQKQIDIFKEVIKYFEGDGFSFRYKHINATAGAVRFPDNEFNLSRIGLGFYGISPFPPESLLDRRLQANLKPALKLITHVCQLKEIRKGETVSYGRTYKAESDKKIAILPIGYFDGIDRRFSNNGSVKINGHFCQIIGKICMNITMVDVGNAGRIKVGDEVVIFDNMNESANSIKNASFQIDAIPYEILCRLSPTTRRVLVS